MSNEDGFIVALDVSVISKRKILEEDVVSKLFSAFADQDDIGVVICPLSQTIQRNQDEAYNKAIDDAIEIVESCLDLKYPVIVGKLKEVAEKVFQLKKPIPQTENKE